MRKSSEIDYTDDNANYDGCQPCPKCKSRNRQRVISNLKEVLYNGIERDFFIRCCDCGFKEEITKDFYDPQGGD